MGPNGSGKTTLVRHFNGLIMPMEGEVRVMGMNVSDRSNLPEIRRRVGLVFQDPDDQMVAVTVEDEIAFGLENLSWDYGLMHERVEETLRRFDLDQVSDRATTSLSGGEQQRVAIAAIWAMDPDILVLDEPTSMLDRPSAMELLHLLDEIASADNVAERRAILHITQNVGEAARAERTIVMDRGRIAIDAPSEDALADRNRLFELGIVQRHRGIPRYIDGIPSPGSNAVSAIEAIDIHHVRNDGPHANPVLRGVSAAMPKGSVLAIVGRSGSGKSTLAWHFNGLLKPDTGEVLLDGTDIQSMPQADVCRRVGMTFQRVDLQLFEMTVADDVAFGLVQRDVPDVESRERTRSALESLGMSFEKYADRSPMALSTGEQRRVALAGALVTAPDVLVLDEPTSGLDARGVDMLIGQIESLRTSDRTLIVVTHDLTFAREIADTVLHMDEGKGAVCGSVDSVIDTLEHEWTSPC